MILVLCGIPGAGKSSVLNALQERFASLKIVNYGDVMLEAGANQGLDRDALRRLPIDKQQEVGLAAAQKIAQRGGQGVTIVDTHAFIRTPMGYIPGIPLKVLNALSPKGLVFLQTSPSIIVERRQRDPSRKRDQESLEELALHQELTRDLLVSASMFTGAVLCIVNNDGKNISDNIQPLVNFIGSKP